MSILENNIVQRNFQQTPSVRISINAMITKWTGYEALLIQVDEDQIIEVKDQNEQQLYEYLWKGTEPKDNFEGTYHFNKNIDNFIGDKNGIIRNGIFQTYEHITSNIIKTMWEGHDVILIRTSPTSIVEIHGATDKSLMLIEWNS